MRVPVAPYASWHSLLSVVLIFSHFVCVSIYHYGLNLPKKDHLIIFPHVFGQENNLIWEVLIQAFSDFFLLFYVFLNIYL